MVKVVIDKGQLSRSVWIREDVLRLKARAFKQLLEKDGNGRQDGPYIYGL